MQYQVIDLWAGDIVAVEDESDIKAVHSVYHARYAGHDAQSETLETNGRAYYQLTARDNGAITVGVRIK